MTAQPVVDVQTANVIQITSAQFELKPGQAEFRESVTVTEFDGTLKSRVIKIGLREEDWELQSIQAQGGVVVQNNEFKTTSELAVYDLAAGTVLFQGNPRWEMDERSGSADLLLVHQETKIVSAQGNVSMELPADSEWKAVVPLFTLTAKSPEGAAECWRCRPGISSFNPPSECAPVTLVILAQYDWLERGTVWSVSSKYRAWRKRWRRSETGHGHRCEVVAGSDQLTSQLRFTILKTG